MSERDNGRTRLIRLIRRQCGRCQACLNVARSEQRPNVANVNDLHRCRAFACVLREELPGRLDCRFSGTQHDDSSARFCCRRSQGDVRSDDRHTGTPDIGRGRPERGASQNDSIGIGCQREKALVCLGSQLVGERPRLIDSLAKIRPHFMLKIFRPQPKRFGCLLKHLPVSIHRVQKRNAHGRMPRYQVCHVDAASWLSRRRAAQSVRLHCCNVVAG
ncbi:hypothetical protein [Paraburkholderia sp. RL17-347-BIC-D]|uniref:hypothetical protein n=1 Tax=Paraburkholderia sp. RL17-347-BIC-D TaxID=3031632 RepID=UPI0038B96881